MLRENNDDLRKQERLFEVFSEKLGLDYIQFPSTGKKYRIDGCLYSLDDGSVRAWVECKWYSGNAHCFLNPPKYNELIILGGLYKIPSYLVFREFDRWGYICLHDGDRVFCDYKLRVSGGTPQGRIPNNDDIEPLVCLNKDKIIWGN